MQSVLDDQFLIQFIGFVGLGVSFLVFQVNRRRSMLRVQIIALLIYSLHFFLLGAFTGAALNIVGATRNYLFDKLHEHKHSNWLPWIFIVVFSIATLLTWQGPLSLLPAIGMIGGTIAFWQSKPETMRLLALISPPAWLAYNLISGSYAGAIAEIIILSSTLLGIYRFDYRDRIHRYVFSESGKNS